MMEVASTRVIEAKVEFRQRDLQSPLVLSSGTITAVTEARVEVTVGVGGTQTTGRGAVYLSDLWAWPDPAIDHLQRDAALRDACRRIAAGLDGLCGGRPAHPWQLGLQLHAAGVDDWPDMAPAAVAAAARRTWRRAIDPRMPPLARILCLSPFDAAVHDAAGQALGCSAFRLYDPPCDIGLADPWFPGVGACRALSRWLRNSPRRVFPATLVVGPADDLPSLLDHWVVGRHYRRVKLKILGRDPEADAWHVERVVAAMIARGVDDPWILLDANEAYGDVARVSRLLAAIERRPQAWRAVRYLEQPTARDLSVVVGDWRPVTCRKPVLLDEALTSPASLLRAVDSGWSGAALKTCKGHSFCLLAAAWLHARGKCVALQDLTNPGYAAMHAALFAAFVPTINGVELNSPQFTPAANADGPWLPQLADLLEPMDGVHRLPAHIPTGLGSHI